MSLSAVTPSVAANQKTSFFCWRCFVHSAPSRPWDCAACHVPATGKLFVSMRGAGVAETQAADRGVWHWQQEIRDKALSCNESRCVAELHCTPAHNTVRVCVPVQTAGSVRMKNLSATVLSSALHSPSSTFDAPRSTYALG